MLRVEGSLTH